MNFWKRKTSWSNTDLGLIKICSGLMGAVIGAFFHKRLEGGLFILVSLYFIIGIYLFGRWLAQLKK